MLKEIITALQSYYKAHLFIKKHRLIKWIIIPGIFYTILFVLSMYVFGITASRIIQSVANKTGLKHWLELKNSGLLGFMFTLESVVAWIVQMLLYFSWFKYIWLIIGSPVFSYLSEKTNAIMHGTDLEISSGQLLKDIKRSVAVAFINLLWQTLYMVSIVLLSFIPVAGWLMPLLALLVECYYYGFSMLDYNLHNNRYTIPESNYYISRHKGLAIGNGIGFYLMQCVPVIGWVMAPAYAIVAGTLSMHAHNKTAVN